MSDKNNPKINFNLDISSFATTIKSNFEEMWTLISKNIDDIELCKSRIEKIEKGPTRKNSNASQIIKEFE